MDGDFGEFIGEGLFGEKGWSSKKDVSICNYKVEDITLPQKLGSCFNAISSNSESKLFGRNTTG
jgi:hypothetical protein